MITLKEITILDDRDYVKECIDLDVTKEQRNFVAANAVSLAQGYLCNHRGEYAKSYAIYAKDQMVGFAMYEFQKLEDDDTFGEDFYYFWRLMIDKNHQGKGYGKQAVEQIIAEVKTLPAGKAEHFYISYEPENKNAAALYKSLGFEETGTENDGETVARLKL